MKGWVSHVGLIPCGARVEGKTLKSGTEGARRWLKGVQRKLGKQSDGDERAPGVWLGGFFFEEQIFGGVYFFGEIVGAAAVGVEFLH